ncbi:hypothetical protein ACFQJ7_02620 [Halovenus rubra]|uniref:Uncharacterized protein n=2 Tax=Halovenus rubra TaxID=869890 RepID=A0ACC7E468_9EURY|nr:hypothetical protein [Halovenus rubra]
MSERQTQKTDDVDLNVDVDVGIDESSPPEENTSGGLARSLYGRTLGRVLSSRGLVVATVLSVVFSALFSLIPFLGLLGSLLGLGGAGFAYGAGSSESRYLELLLAGGAVGGGSALLGNLLVITFGSTVLLGLGLLGGAGAAVVGHYFGRDFRRGLTRDIN